MKRLGTAVAGVVLLAGLAVAVADLRRAAGRWEGFGPLSVGSDLPAFSLPRLGGKAFTREDLLGRVSIVTFWASWCTVCSSEMPMYQDLHEAFAGDPGVQVVLVNREGSDVVPERARDIVNRTARERELTMPLVIDDGRLYAAMRASVLPHTVVVDAQGRIRHVHPGRVMRRTLLAEVKSLQGAP